MASVASMPRSPGFIQPGAPWTMRAVRRIASGVKSPIAAWWVESTTSPASRSMRISPGTASVGMVQSADAVPSGVSAGAVSSIVRPAASVMRSVTGMPAGSLCQSAVFTIMPACTVSPGR